MSEVPNFDQIALRILDSIGVYGQSLLAPIADELRQVWTARGAADAQVIANALAEPTDIAPWAELKALDR